MRGTPIEVPPPAAVGPGGANGRVDEVLASARLFGSRRPGVLSDNVRPLGVVADASGRGSVIVSVDGQPAKVYRVGDTLDGRQVAAIRADEIELESGGARQVFRLPPPRPSSTGLTVLGTGPAPASAAAVVSAPQQSPMSMPGTTPLQAPETPMRAPRVAPVRGPGATPEMPLPPPAGG